MVAGHIINEWARPIFRFEESFSFISLLSMITLFIIIITIVIIIIIINIVIIMILIQEGRQPCSHDEGGEAGEGRLLGQKKALFTLPLSRLSSLPLLRL